MRGVEVGENVNVRVCDEFNVLWWTEVVLYFPELEFEQLVEWNSAVMKKYEIGRAHV